jgi:hypothetical protein
MTITYVPIGSDPTGTQAVDAVLLFSNIHLPL